MNDSVFLDSNILIYSYSNTEVEKNVIARKIIENSNSFIGTQVLQELCNVVTKKFKFSYSQAILGIKEWCENNNLYVNTADTIILACELADRYRFSFFDSMIVAAALEIKCSTLYSEDSSNGQLINGKLKVVNPFVSLL